jgi:hypothetical protein
MHKSIIILLGLLVFLIPVGPSSMINSNVLAFEDYGYEADQYEQYANDMTNDNYHKSQNSELVKKIKCNNINANLNGIGVSLGDPTNDNTLAEAQAGDDEGQATTADVNGWGNGYNQNGNNFRFVCINNNDNENNVVVVNETTPIPPEPTTAILIVTKTTICDRQEFGDFCNFNPKINVNGNTPTPSSFLANDTPVSVTLGAGLYEVIEEGFELGFKSCFPGFQGGQLIGQVVAACTNFDDSCSEDIGAGQELSCTIENTITCIVGSCSPEEVDSTLVSQETTDSSITTQGIENSPIISQSTGDSSTLEKLTKLKTQWLNQLP